MELQLNRLANACGCGESVICSLIAEACYLIYIYLIGFENDSFIFLKGIAIFFLAGLIGKLLGLFHAKLRLRNRLRGLAMELLPDGAR